MIKLKLFTVLIGCLFATTSFSQCKLSGVVTSTADSTKVIYCNIYLEEAHAGTLTDTVGFFEFKNIPNGTYTLNASCIGYATVKQTIIVNKKHKHVSIAMVPDHLIQDSVLIDKPKETTHMRGVENMGIYEGKKSEVIIPDKLVANLATNNARQVYSRIPGLNIWENDGAGIQLSVGGRGLDPNRTSNFNVRQNGYDISADALGYPESYYTPPIEAIGKIQIVRGAASLQYGTQFGGLLNFVLRKPVEDKKIQLVARQTGGSFGFYNTFTSLSGTVGKFSYYTFYQYKRGDGWRPNSEFNNSTFYSNVNYKLSDKSKVGMDVTVMDYLSKQPGGLSDDMFYEDARQSNRSRNWFKVKWNMLAFHYDHKFNATNEFNVRLFGLSANRFSLGFRPNRVATLDDNSERDLIKGDFTNWGAEARYLKRYTVAKKHFVLLTGARYYHGFNHSTQGQGSTGKDADFNYIRNNLMTYDYRFPNRNLALFAENIIYLSDKLSLTPGIRYEYIKTTADGYYGNVLRDLAGNVIDFSPINEKRTNGRSFILGGIGLSYKPSSKISFYSNLSQNYRSITFNDMRISNPSSVIDPNMKDEKGFSYDVGMRSENTKKLNYDVSLFYLSYNNRIGEVLTYDDKDRSIRMRGNIGQAVMMGVESYVESDVLLWFNPEIKNWSTVVFANGALIHSEYVKSQIPGVKGNKVEFVPTANVKTGIRAGYKDFKASFQYTFLSDQFSEATNAVDGGVSAVSGLIPAYAIMDFSMSYQFKRYKVEGSINNLGNQMYFTRRATGYPGPGILPSDGRSFYLTLQVKI